MPPPQTPFPPSLLMGSPPHNLVFPRDPHPQGSPVLLFWRVAPVFLAPFPVVSDRLDLHSRSPRGFGGLCPACHVLRSLPESLHTACPAECLKGCAGVCPGAAAPPGVGSWGGGGAGGGVIRVHPLGALGSAALWFHPPGGVMHLGSQSSYRKPAL